MQVIVRSKTSFYTQQFDEVSSVTYNGTTHIATISYGESSTASFNTEDYLIFVRSIL